MHAGPVSGRVRHPGHVAGGHAADAGMGSGAREFQRRAVRRKFWHSVLRAADRAGRGPYRPQASDALRPAGSGDQHAGRDHRDECGDADLLAVSDRAGPRHRDAQRLCAGDRDRPGAPALCRYCRNGQRRGGGRDDCGLHRALADATGRRLAHGVLCRRGFAADRMRGVLFCAAGIAAPAGRAQMGRSAHCPLFRTGAAGRTAIADPARSQRGAQGAGRHRVQATVFSARRRRSPACADAALSARRRRSPDCSAANTWARRCCSGGAIQWLRSSCIC